MSANAEKVVAIGLQENKEYAKGTEVTLRVYIPEGEPITNILGEKVTDPDGNPVSFGIGKTYVAITPDGSPFSYK